jgi:hypothetical protein
MGWLFDGFGEGEDFFVIASHKWSAPLAANGEFEFEGTLFSWLGKALRYRYGAATVEIWMHFDASEGGFFGHVGNGNEVCAEINGINALNREWSTRNIKNKDLRAAVELGLRAWQAQLAISKTEALDALGKHS